MVRFLQKFLVTEQEIFKIIELIHKNCQKKNSKNLVKIKIKKKYRNN